MLGDGAYNTFECYKAAYLKRANLVVPPRKGAVINDEGDHWLRKRNESISEIIGLGETTKTR
ncbi:MAG: hypothetical protein Tsb0021_10140 [Chlamydiales bacterium]